MNDEAHLDRWNDGAIDGYRGHAQRSQDSDYLDGYAQGRSERKIVVVMPPRPEGYYHAPVGTFD